MAGRGLTQSVNSYRYSPVYPRLAREILEMVYPSIRLCVCTSPPRPFTTSRPPPRSRHDKRRRPLDGRVGCHAPADGRREHAAGALCECLALVAMARLVLFPLVPLD